MESTPQFTDVQKGAALAISVVALLIFAAHEIRPERVVLDEATLGLLALAALPWLTLFFKSFKIPGIGEAETRDRVQGSTQRPLPPPAGRLRSEARPDLSADAKKVLATLWRYQRLSFGSDTTKRWTFALHPFAEDYARFLAGLSETVGCGWVAVSPDTHQCMLTNEGLSLVAANPELQEYADVYWF